MLLYLVSCSSLTPESSELVLVKPRSACELGQKEKSEKTVKQRRQYTFHEIPLTQVSKSSFQDSISSKFRDIAGFRGESFFSRLLYYFICFNLLIFF